MKYFYIAAMAAFIFPSFASAECKIWDIEDTSAGVQKRAVVFVAAERDGMEGHVSQGYVIAKEIAQSKRLSYIDVFVTRPQDGFDRSKHSQMTSTVHIKFNPGKTPLNNGKRLSATALEDPNGAVLSNGKLGFARVNLDEEQIDKIWRNYLGPIDFECR